MTINAFYCILFYFSRFLWLTPQLLPFKWVQAVFNCRHSKQPKTLVPLDEVFVWTSLFEAYWHTEAYINVSMVLTLILKEQHLHAIKWEGLPKAVCHRVLFLLENFCNLWKHTEYTAFLTLSVTFPSGLPMCWKNKVCRTTSRSLKRKISLWCRPNFCGLLGSGTSKSLQ